MRLFARTLLILLPLLLCVACATIGPPQPPSLELPKPPADLQAKRKGDHVILTWTIPTATTDRQTIRTLGPTRICRGSGELKECGTPVGETDTPVSRATATHSRQKNKDKDKASYSATLPAELLSSSPSATVTYAVEVLNRDRRGAGISNQVQVPLIRTLPPPRDFQAHVTSQGVVLSWTGDLASDIPQRQIPQKEVRYLYRAYRRQEGSQQAVVAGEVSAESGHSLTLTDSSIDWEKTYEYRVEAVTVIASAGKPDVQVEGDDTAEVKVFADDVFPPAVPSGLQAVFSGPGQQPFVDLVWAPVTDLDLDGYYVYRREEGAAPAKINRQLVKNPAYRDSSVAPGKRYVYSVSAVDVRGNESARSEEASEAVPQ
jgi:hypothetical protein